MKCCVYYRR